MTRLHRIALAAVVVAAACTASRASELPPGSVTLEVALPGSFAAVSNVVELSDGRVAFADTKNRTVHVGDFAKQAVTALGRHVDTVTAQTPAEAYKFPGALARLAGDTLAVIDFAATRTTLFGEDGSARGVLPIAPVSGATPVLIYDHVGHGYKVDYQAIVGGGEPGRLVRPDSIPLLRLSLGLTKADTAGFLSAPEYGEAQFGEQHQEVAKIFSPIDAFGVLPDGTLWIARARRNAVDWRAPNGTWTTGKGRPFDAVPVTQADKDRVMARLHERGLPQGVAVTFPFEPTKPAFEQGFTRPNGEVWLQRSRADEEAPLTYDVWGRDGAWQRAVVFPAGVTLAGFGKTAIYATAKQTDGSRSVGRYAEAAARKK